MPKQTPIDHWKSFYYMGPDVPSGVVYGAPNSPSHSYWLVPGFVKHPDSKNISDVLNYLQIVDFWIPQ